VESGSVAGGVGLDEAVEALALADEAVLLAGEAFEGGGVGGEGVGDLLERGDVGPNGLQLDDLGLLVLLQAPEVEEGVLAPEGEEVDSARR
jgi:hypothetical protein